MTRGGTGRAKARTVTAIGIGSTVLLGSFSFYLLNWTNTSKETIGLILLAALLTGSLSIFLVPKSPRPLDGSKRRIYMFDY